MRWLQCAAREVPRQAAQMKPSEEFLWTRLKWYDYLVFAAIATAVFGFLIPWLKTIVGSL